MLTGRYYFKNTWHGLILYVEYAEIQGIPTLIWRKAKEEDIVELDLNYKKQ